MRLWLIRKRGFVFVFCFNLISACNFLMVINQSAFFHQQLQHHKIYWRSMNRQGNKSQPFPEDQSFNQGQKQIYQIDWNHVCKQQALSFPSTQPFCSFYQPFSSTMPFLQSPFRYSSFQSRLPASGFRYFPMSCPYQFQVPDSQSDFQKTFANTQAPNDEQSKKEVKNIKNQEVNSEHLYIKQECQIQQYLLNKDQINLQLQAFLIPQINSNVLPNTERSSEITRKDRVNRYKIKKEKRVFQKRIVYQCRKSVADNRQRCKGRFVKRVEITEENIANEKSMKKQQIKRC